MALQGGNQRLLLIALLNKLLQEQGASPPQAKAANPSELKQWLQKIKQAKDAYDTGKDIYNLGTSVYNGITGAETLTPATQAAWNQAAGEASQAAWNAGANAASGAEEGASSASGGGSSLDGSYAAAAVSALNSARRVLNKNASDEQQNYDAAMAVPRAVAAYYTLGLSELGEGFARKQWGGTMKKLDKFNQTNPMSPVFLPMQASRLWTSDKWKTEGNRLKALQKSGVEIPEWAQARMFQKRGIRKKELLHPGYDNSFQGPTPDGFVDNLFENTRDESKMAPETMQKYAVWAEKRPDWFNLSDAQRRAATLAARDAGALREHHGTLDINDQVFNKDALDKAIASAPMAQQQAPVQQRPSRYILKNGELFLRKGMK